MRVVPQAGIAAGLVDPWHIAETVRCMPGEDAGAIARRVPDIFVRRADVARGRVGVPADKARPRGSECHVNDLLGSAGQATDLCPADRKRTDETRLGDRAAHPCSFEDAAPGGLLPEVAAPVAEARAGCEAAAPCPADRS